MKIRKFMFVTVFVILGFTGSGAAKAANFLDYNPFTLGSYWTYRNGGAPFDSYTVSVFERFTFGGQPAVKCGTDGNNYGIVYKDGGSVILYGYMEDGVLYDSPDVSISTITDGMFYQLGEPTNYQLIRMWDNIDPSLKTAYQIDPTLKDLMLIAAYDSNYPRNNQNDIVEAGLGISFPNYGVTHLEWYQIGIGMITERDVDASTGALGDRYNLINYRIATSSLPVSQSMAVASSFLCVDFGAIGIWKYNGAWRQIAVSNPEAMTAAGSVLYGDFGKSGIWMWNGTGWSNITE